MPVEKVIEDKEGLYLLLYPDGPRFSPYYSRWCCGCFAKPSAIVETLHKQGRKKVSLESFKRIKKSDWGENWSIEGTNYTVRKVKLNQYLPITPAKQL